ncbi:AAA family ATPase [Haloferula sp. A504]|uniref:AAA family ATPase n=1 Tax=Haloferula sp. A504 TaxID=3373601 RepID=UPI0031C562C4|nr:AAA family ATPase [Verrucomicrobiaceae bacterium E54]
MSKEPKDLRERFVAEGPEGIRKFAEGAAQVSEGQPLPESPKAVPLMDLRTEPPEGAELLKSRLMFRAEGMVVVGQTGGGKSTLSIGMALHWGCGRIYLGIAPSGPLKILIVEAEDVEWTNGFMRDGALVAMEPLDDWERKLLKQNVHVCETRSHVGPGFFDKVLRPLLEKHRPDLVFINPAFSYLGGEANSAVDVADFLRVGLNPLLEEFDCGAVVFHHTNKLPGIESQRMKDVNPLYLASGHNEWNNWPRVGLAMMPTSDPEIMALVATKRPKAAGWRDDEGNLTSTCYIQRSADPGEPSWTMIGCVEARKSMAEASPKKAGRPAKITFEIIERIALEAGVEGIRRAELTAQCEDESGAANSTCRERVRQALEREILVVLREEQQKRADGSPVGCRKIQVLGHREAIAENFPSIDGNPIPAVESD